MKGRYVMFRVFAKNKFANKKEFIGGEILGHFDNLREVAESKHYITHDDIQKMVTQSKKFRKSPGKSEELTYEKAREEMVLTILDMLERRLKLSGHLCNINVDKFDDEELNKLITGRYHQEDKPISFITIDTKYVPKHGWETEHTTYMKFLREIKFNSLDIKD
jgi:hypothetical protein